MKFLQLQKGGLINLHWIAGVHWLQEQLPLIAYPGYAKGESQVSAGEERE